MEHNIEESAQIKYNIPVIVNGLITMNNDKVPLYMTGTSETAINYDVQATDLLVDCECDSVFPKMNLNLNSCINNTHMSVSRANMIPNLKEDVKADTNRKLNLRTRDITNDSNAEGRVNYAESKYKHKHKILLVGDSHVKRCATELQQILDHRYSVMGISKPGANTRNILETADKESNSLSSNDILILWVGTNYINNNNIIDARRCLKKFCEIHKDANIILIQAPHRHDLISTSCINREVVKYNRQIKKVMKLYANVRILEMDLQRCYFTRHGQHLNCQGKEMVALELTKMIQQQHNKTRNKTLQMPWEKDNRQESSKVPLNEVGELIETKAKETVIVGGKECCNIRNRRPPPRSEDFL
ncbi:MAG: hypothetical protein LBF12_04155 [Christensenellaceae bacterium]|nr:hypothetical protein [Christensenellaceae bacterium]